MIRLEKTETIPLTRKVAIAHMNQLRWIGDRPIRSARRAMLENALREGLFMSPTWSKAAIGDKLYRMDGQASSTVLAECSDFPAGLDVTIRWFRVDTEEELAQLFGQFDSVLSSRKQNEIVGSYAAVYPDLRGIPERHVSTLISGVMLLDNKGAMPRKYSANERGKMVGHYIPWIVWGSQFMKTPLFERSSVSAAIYATYQAKPETAADFWTLVRDESHPDPANPTRVLRRFLNEAVLGIQVAKLRRSWDQRSILVKSIHSWNAWRRNSTTDLKYHANAEFPRVV